MFVSDFILTPVAIIRTCDDHGVIGRHLLVFGMRVAYWTCATK